MIASERLGALDVQPDWVIRGQMRGERTRQVLRGERRDAGTLRAAVRLMGSTQPR